MDAKHTPGPWTMGWEGAVREPGLGRPCVGTTGHADWVGPHGAEADARLIAAAPDLLALVERMAHVPMGDALRYYIEIGNDARLILARATGGGR